jgi:hypothetical protein
MKKDGEIEPAISRMTCETAHRRQWEGGFKAGFMLELTN